MTRDADLTVALMIIVVGWLTISRLLAESLRDDETRRGAVRTQLRPPQVKSLTNRSSAKRYEPAGGNANRHLA